MWGKVFGGLFGFMFGKFFGAALGLYLGHLFDKGMKQDFDKVGGFQRFFHKEENDKQAVFFYTTFAVMGHMAKSTGRVTELHIKAASLLMDDMKLHGEQREEAQEAFREGKLAGFPLDKHLKEFKHHFAGRQELAQMFLEIQIQVAFCDGIIQAEEAEILQEIAKSLGFSKGELSGMLKRWQAEFRFHQRREDNKRQRQQSNNRSSHQSSGNQHHGQSQGRDSHERSQRSQNAAISTLADAYKVLGVKQNCDEKVAKKAYRKLMAQHHPDKLVSKGLPPEMMEIAKRKAQDIQAAYELIKAQK